MYSVWSFGEFSLFGMYELIKIWQPWSRPHPDTPIILNGFPGSGATLRQALLKNGVKA
jgi:hypothetical protein